MSRGINLDGGSRPTQAFEFKELNNYPGRVAKYTNVAPDKRIKDALVELFQIPRQGTGVPKERLTKISLEILTHIGYVKDCPNLPIVIINDTALKAFKELTNAR